jgi:hypothetical protein
MSQPARPTTFPDVGRDLSRDGNRRPSHRAMSSRRRRSEESSSSASWVVWKMQSVKGATRTRAAQAGLSSRASFVSPAQIHMASTPTIISAEDSRASPTSYSRPPPGSPMPRGPTRSPPRMARARSRRTRSLGPTGRVRLPTRRVRPPRRTRAISSAEPEPVSLSSVGHDEEHAVTVAATHHDAGRPHVRVLPTDSTLPHAPHAIRAAIISPGRYCSDCSRGWSGSSQSPHGEPGV